MSNPRQILIEAGIKLEQGLQNLQASVEDRLYGLWVNGVLTVRGAPAPTASNNLPKDKNGNPSVASSWVSDVDKMMLPNGNRPMTTGPGTNWDTFNNFFKEEDINKLGTGQSKVSLTSDWEQKFKNGTGGDYLESWRNIESTVPEVKKYKTVLTEFDQLQPDWDWFNLGGKGWEKEAIKWDFTDRDQINYNNFKNDQNK